MGNQVFHRFSCYGSLIAVVLVVASPVLGDWQLHADPADVDKQRIWDATWDWNRTDRSCWMAAAANLLASAGYGIGATIQERGEDIYRDMIIWQDININGVLDGYFDSNGRYYGDGLTAGGWTHTALDWWLGSAHNIWKGAKTHLVISNGVDYQSTTPWNNPNLPMELGNTLRSGTMASIEFARTDLTNPVGQGGALHVITVQGDNGPAAQLSSNPTVVKVTDSDEDTDPATGLLTRFPGLPIQDHTWFDYGNPPVKNEGPGWYFRRKEETPYVLRYVALEGTPINTDNGIAQLTVGSYRIRQLHPTDAADSLHYDVSSTSKMLNWNTTLDHETTISPTITFDAHGDMHAEWQFSTPVPSAEFVTITTQIVTPESAGLAYDNVAFNVGATVVPGLPNFAWLMADTQFAPNISQEIGSVTDEWFYDEFATGGFIIGAFDILEGRSGEKIAEYRFLHEYRYDEDPEAHVFTLHSLVTEEADEHNLGQLRFGHSYVFRDEKALWEFEEWSEVSRELITLTPTTIITHMIDWEGCLPYPRVEYIGTDYIPEPATLTLLVLGVLSMIMRCRRRRR